ncbi:hypothetical protein CPU12_09450 [Malaciobacter molluscorum LMG 25693]|uniref:Acyloxyacyl hydrolase n=1 Tax=Malaciobacter molluscorum LMG 25693 TaxID=870501 RepID=A0A2G1DGN5_9BACT|nr:acyloxyacyl hydrolase [Malaciobacter molluscorum]AXX92475.1 acyloxyacyl hydrolase [Malaciobacter molluscorum LMG 25693]PHO17655.1 hypothetical protein CPU12_09450 [Malaciobacter molluscorum LMG 25693]RXJ93447.1 hypothetical protein CRV00_10990 [Malaciobacter molluscorum]
MKKILIVLLFVVSSLFSFDKMSLGYSTTSDDSNIFDVTVIKNTDYKIFGLPVSFEGSFDYMDSAHESDDLFIGSIQGVLTYNFNKDFFMQGGFGFAYLSDKSFEDKKFGTNFQFKESILFGYNISDSFSTTLRYNHISNADINDDNSGLDIYGINFIYKF